MSPTTIRNLLVVASLALLGALIGWGVHTWNEHQREIGRGEIRAADAQDAAAAGLINAKETQRRLDKQEENQRERDEARARAVADAARARAAAGQLQQRVDELVAATCGAAGDPATGSHGQAACDPARVLAELQRRADERAGILAEFADGAHGAGKQCEADYDALKPSP